MKGVLEVAAAIRLRREIAGEIWLGLSGVLSVFFGLLLIWLLVTRPLATLISMGWVIAFHAALLGMVLLLLALRLRRIVRLGAMVELTVARSSRQA